jgi:hypothetical protein
VIQLYIENPKKLAIAKDEGHKLKVTFENSTGADPSKGEVVDSESDVTVDNPVAVDGKQYVRVSFKKGAFSKVDRGDAIKACSAPPPSENPQSIREEVEMTKNFQLKTFECGIFTVKFNLDKHANMEAVRRPSASSIGPFSYH